MPGFKARKAPRTVPAADAGVELCTTETRRPSAVASITRSEERRSFRTASASASARSQRSPCCIDSDLSSTIACSRAFAFAVGRTRSVSSGPANASTSAMSNRMRSDSSSQYRNVRLAVRWVSLASTNINDANGCCVGFARATRCSQIGTPIASRPSRNRGARNMAASSCPRETTDTGAARDPAARRWKSAADARRRRPRPCAATPGARRASGDTHPQDTQARH